VDDVGVAPPRIARRHERLRPTRSDAREP
jgi:hypothetical protein